MMRAAIMEALKRVRADAADTFQALASRLRLCAGVDRNPLIARNYIGLSMHDVFQEVADSAVDHFEDLR